jgi:hypothetical protein
MPWRGPSEPGEWPTLGYDVADWIQDCCVIPDGEQQGDPFILTDEQLWFVLCHYRLRPEVPAEAKPAEAFHFERGSQLVRPQKWGKGPLSAALICAEAAGPVVFDGWDSKGEPVGRPWATPHIQVTAVSEDQTDNVFRALLPMIELGDLKADVPDTGLTRVNLPGGGLIEPVTASARSRLGQRITFAVQDETHSWLKTNGGQKLADNQRRNLAGMGGRFVETTNAWDPTERSVAQDTFENPVAVHVDYPPPLPGSVRNKRERRRVMRAGYGDSTWVSIDRIDVEVEALLSRDPAQAERFFLNRVHAGESVAFDMDRWTAATSPREVPFRSLITVGVDGARFHDAVAGVATEVSSGYQWPLFILERPENADDDYEHDFDAIDGAMVEAWARWKVWRVYIDPQYIEKLVERWEGRWGDRKVISWFTNRPRQVGYAVRKYREAISTGELANDGDVHMARHIGNARRSDLTAKDAEGRPMWTLAKEAPGRKIDAAMAGILSWEARGDCVADGRLGGGVPRRIR